MADLGTAILNLPVTATLADADIILLARPSGTTAAGIDLGISAYNLRRQITQNPTYSLTKNDVGLGNVDNTADVNKPVSGPVALAIRTAAANAAPAWQPFTAAELNADKQAYAGLLERAVILLLVNGQTGPTPAPAAPTAGQVDDIGHTFSFTPNPAYLSFAQYKANGIPGTSGPVVLSAVNSYPQAGRIYVKITGPVVRGGLALYVAGSGSLPDGAVLTNADPFTYAAPVAPTITSATFTAA